jgi:DNA primase
MISQRTITEILETAKIEEVVDDFLNIKRRGSNFIGLCPFHDEKTPSFSVSPSKNIFKCFGCGRGGNSVQFIMEHEKYTFPEALRYLASKYQIQVEETYSDDQDKEARQEIESLYLINEYASDFYQDNLFNSQDGKAVGLSYFKERGYREATIKKFQLGFALAKKDAFTLKATLEGHSIDKLRDLGLVTKFDRDFFRNRVIFPIHNFSGKTIAFAGRVLSSKKKEPKYINSPESVIYNKRKILYGLFLARTQIRKLDTCILVEGYTDVISLHQSGIENVVASSGTALTADQIRAIKRYTRNIIILYDSDPAGVQAALRGLDLILEEDMNARLVLLPEGEDPDSLISRLGQHDFEEFLNENAKDFILFKANQLNEEAQRDPIKRSLMIRDIVSSIALIPDAIKRAMYIKECSRVLDIEERTLIAETNTSIRANLKKRGRDYRNESQHNYDHQLLPEEKKKAASQDISVGQATDEYQEKDIVRILLNAGHNIYDEAKELSVAQYILDNIRDVLDSFENPLYKKILKIYNEKLEEGHVLHYNELINHADAAIRTLAIEVLASPFEYSDNWEDMRDLPLQTQKKPEFNFIRDSYQSILRFKLRKIMKKIAENQALIDTFSNNNDDEKVNLHLKIHYELLKFRDQITSEFKSVVIKL